MLALNKSFTNILGKACAPFPYKFPRSVFSAPGGTSFQCIRFFASLPHSLSRFRSPLFYFSFIPFYFSFLLLFFFFYPLFSADSSSGEKQKPTGRSVGILLSLSFFPYSVKSFWPSQAGIFGLFYKASIQGMHQNKRAPPRLRHAAFLPKYKAVGLTIFSYAAQ